MIHNFSIPTHYVATLKQVTADLCLQAKKHQIPFEL